MTPIDYGVMLAYFGLVIAIGVHFGRQQKDASDYFLGRHTLPWWAVMLSVVATETSALTVISVPGIAARGDFTFLQLSFGYLIGRIGVAAWLLPGYFAGEQETAYVRLEHRFGVATRRSAAGIFMGIRAVGDSVRVFATAIPLAIILQAQLGSSEPIRRYVVVAILVVGIVTLLYTLLGGIKAVVWVDVVQLGIYVLGGIATIVVAASLVGGLGAIVDRAMDAGKLTTFNWPVSFTTPYSFLGAVLGGALLSAASHGTDHLIVQRLLATRSLRAARRALIGSGILVITQFALFLFVGTALWAAGADDLSRSSDQLYPRFVLSDLPTGLAGVVVAGLLAAAMSTVSSSLNSLASATTHDFYAPLTKTKDPEQLLRFGRKATVGWAAVLVGIALPFRSTEQPVVEIALSVASITYGSLLGTYILSALPRVRQRDVIAAMSLAALMMVVIVLVNPPPFTGLAWPWYVPLGTTLTLAIGLLASTVPQRTRLA